MQFHAIHTSYRKIGCVGRDVTFSATVKQNTMLKVSLASFRTQTTARGGNQSASQRKRVHQDTHAPRGRGRPRAPRSGTPTHPEVKAVLVMEAETSTRSEVGVSSVAEDGGSLPSAGRARTERITRGVDVS